MKVFSVSFTKPVPYTYMQEQRVLENGRYRIKEVAVTAYQQDFTLYSLKEAKSLIKANLPYYASSQITKIFSNGDFENLGEITLKGSNKHFIANTRMTKPNY